MGLVLDAAFAAIVLCFIVAGYRAGLMRTLVEFVGYLFAVVASVVLAGLVADGLADLFLQARSPSPAEYYFLRVIATAIVFVLLQMLVRITASAVSAVSVSYTHLDVYKIQGQYSANLLGKVFSPGRSDPFAAFCAGTSCFAGWTACGAVFCLGAGMVGYARKVGKIGGG